jgi:uncharacterized protein YfaS (alpha-2-macroglobulin family)
MGIIKEYEVGDTARFRTIFKDNEGNVIEPDSTNGDHDVDIEITDLSADDVLVSTEQMTEVSDTVFRYDWQTTEGMRLGEYEVEVRGNFDGDEALNRDRIKLVRSKKR